jgi:hypothetical protein
MIIHPTCQYCEKSFAWDNGLEYIIVSNDISWAPRFCSDECQEASENEIDWKSLVVEPEVDRFFCSECGHHQFYRVNGWEKTLWPPILTFACRGCGQVYDINAGDIYEFDGNHMVLKNSANPHKFAEKIQYKGEYKWTSTHDDFFKYFNKFRFMDKGPFFGWQKMGYVVMDSRFLDLGISEKPALPHNYDDRDPSSAGLI